MSIKTQETAKEFIILLLEDMKEATTAELMNEIEKLGVPECRDRVPSALAELSSKGLIKKSISREKKAIMWSLA
ncbi:MAG: hypothetical protein ACFE95_14730 [Candidatus Hodarchaeota archaeon]